MRLMAEQRRNEVVAALSRDGSVTVKSLAEKLAVSMETIRKDIRYWEEKGVLRKTHGGALLSSKDTARHINQRIVENVEAKNRIAAEALEYIPEKGIIYLDSGSTILCLARRILSARSGLTIVTNSIIIANTLVDSSNSVLLTGGRLREDVMATSGFWTEQALDTLCIDVAALGCSGFRGFNGPAVELFSDAEVKRVILARSRFTMVVADSEKFKSTARVSYCGWRDIDLFISNSDADEPMAQEIRHSTKLVLV